MDDTDLIICGGMDSKNDDEKANVYRVSTIDWSIVKLKSMSTARHSHKLISFRGQQYAIAGSNDSTPLDSVEVYTESNDEWHEFARLNTPRRGHSVCVIKEENIYVFCGESDNENCINSIERLNNEE